MKPNCSTTWLAIVGFALLLYGCGGGTSVSTTAPLLSITAATTSSAKATQVITTGGGSISLTTENGTQFELSVPAGALPTDTSITLQSQDKIGGQYFNLRLLPAGLLFSNGIQATLTIALPSGVSLPASGALAYDGVPFPFTRLPDGRLQLLLSGFASGSTLAPAVFAKPQKTAGISETPHVTSSSTCAGVPQLGNFAEGELTAAEVNEADVYGQCMLAAVSAMASQGQYAQAARTASAIAAYLQRIGAGGASSHLAQAQAITCAAYKDRLDQARATPVTTMDSLYRLVKPILFWEMTAQQLGANCTVSPYNIALDDYQTVTNSKTSEALTYYQARKASITSTQGVEYTEAVQEAKDSQITVSEVKALRPSAPVKAVLAAQIEQRAQPGLLDAMLQAPWQRCRDSGNYDKLIELMQTLDKPQVVKTAAQYCATQLDAQAKDASNSVTAVLSPSLGGVRANEQRTSGSIAVQKDGKLFISGLIQKLQCPIGSEGGSESLVIKFNGITVSTQTGTPYLANTLALSIASLLQAVNILPENFTGGALTLERSGSPCGGYWGDSPTPLLSANLSVAGVCVPEVGQEYCFTVVEVPNANYTTKPIRLSQSGHVLFQHERTGFVWHSGTLRALPALFIPVDIADDGTVGGDQFENAVDSTTHPTVVKLGATTGIRLATSVRRTGAAVDFPMWNPNGQLATFFSLSANGRATYRVGDEGYSTTDLGYCGGFNLSLFCWTFTFYESIGPTFSSGSPIRTDQLPGSSAQFLVFQDADSLGRVGQVGYVTSSAGIIYAAKDFVAGASNARNWAISRTGRVLLGTWDLAADLYTSSQLNPASTYIPANWYPFALGWNDHTLICTIGDDASPPRFRLLNLSTGQMTAEQTNPLTVRKGEHDIHLTVGCVQRFDYSRWIDGLGRLLVEASSATNPNVRAAILTPRGIALP
jgi:hypothetical protein